MSVMPQVEVESGSGLSLVNESGLDTSVIAGDPQFRSLAAKLSAWVSMGRETAARRGDQGSSMFDRRVYTPPDNVYQEMTTARHAVATDDVVAGVAEITEGLAMQGLKWESLDPDQADVFNQMAGDLDLDSTVRRMWREMYTYSQVVVAQVWGFKEYTVRGFNPAPKVRTFDQLGNEVWEPKRDASGNPVKGSRRKKRYRVFCPVDLRVLDPLKIVPLQSGPLGAERLAWQATDAEIGDFESMANGNLVDDLLGQFFTGRYVPRDPAEMARLGALGVDTTRLMLCNPDRVARLTATKADYERHADVRLKSCFTLLDLKRQLIASDRAALIGSANYLLLIKKGSEKEPATQEEIDNLRQGYSVLARLPVIISDHRLSIEIVCPKVDLVLNDDKYTVLDTRLLARLLGTLSLGARGQRNETNVTISYAVGRGMESRRHMIKRFLERTVAKAIVEHPANAGVFGEEPNLVWTPRNVALGADAARLQAMLSLRTQREMSRETMLEYMGLDQATEALRMEIEQDVFDEVFKTRIPFSSPLTDMGSPADMGSPQANGATGGRPRGGGGNDNPIKVDPQSDQGNPSTNRGQ